MSQRHPHLCILLASAAILSAAQPVGTAFAHEVGAAYSNVSEFTYTTEIKNAPKDTDKELLALTEAEKQKSNPPPTVYLLQRRLDNDAQTLIKALHAKGFYDAQVTTEIDREKQPYTARFHINAGEVYTLQSVRIILDPRSQTEDVTLPDIAAIDLPLGGAVNYEQILNARGRIRSRIHENNCLREVRVRAHLRVDTTEKEAEAIYRVRSGKEATFGALTVDGLETVEMPYIDRRIPWKQGDCYKPQQIESLQVNLLQTNLFSKSEITIAEEPDENGEYPVTLSVRERPQRTIKAGIGYATEDGLDFKPSWEHRNFFGQGEKVTVEGTISTFLQSVKGRLERPDFMRKEQFLVLESEIAQSETDAYDSTSFRSLAQVSRPVGKNLTAALGVAYALKRVDDEGRNSGEETFSLVSFPSYLQHNTRNSDIDPTSGHLLRLDVEPFIETLNTGDVFLKNQGSARWYHQHENIPLKPTWAFRATLGSIMGSAASDIPADERFYSGGGGSVRGYGFQSLGPQINGAPTGGRSLVEFSGELRLRVTDSIGLVPFIDAGNVYPEIYPEFDGDLFYAAGLGLRYYTDFGPFRFDVAMPMDRRDDIDDAFQLYISFGQSF